MLMDYSYGSITNNNVNNTNNGLSNIQNPIGAKGGGFFPNLRSK